MRCPTNQANRFAFGGILGICLLIAAMLDANHRAAERGGGRTSHPASAGEEGGFQFHRGSSQQGHRLAPGENEGRNHAGQEGAGRCRNPARRPRHVFLPWHLGSLRDGLDLPRSGSDLDHPRRGLAGNHSGGGGEPGHDANQGLCGAGLDRCRGRPTNSRACAFPGSAAAVFHRPRFRVPRSAMGKQEAWGSMEWAGVERCGGNGYGRHGRGWNGRHGHGWNGRRLYEHGRIPTGVAAGQRQRHASEKGPGIDSRKGRRRPREGTTSVESGRGRHGAAGGGGRTGRRAGSSPPPARILP